MNMGGPKLCMFIMAFGILTGRGKPFLTNYSMIHKRQSHGMIKKPMTTMAVKNNDNNDNDDLRMAAKYSIVDSCASILAQCVHLLSLS